MTKSIDLRLTTFLSRAMLAIRFAEGRQPGRSDPPKWIDEVQTDAVLPLLPQRAGGCMLA
jgi:hypothetical protein